MGPLPHTGLYDLLLILFAIFFFPQVLCFLKQLFFPRLPRK